MSLKISRILHAGYVFECDGAQIACDPIFENPFSRNCYAFPPVQFDHEAIRATRFAAVFISHFHDDHCSLDSLDLLHRDTPIYLYCLYGELFDMIRALGFRQVEQLRIDAPVRVGPFEVIARAAFDADVDSMLHIRAAGFNILNVVDAWIAPDGLPELARYAPWDMVLWPFQTMRELAVISPKRADPPVREIPSDWIEQLSALHPRFVVPSSCQFVQEEWSWYNQAFFPISYRQFEHEVAAALPGTEVVRMNPSVSFVLDGQSLQAAPPLAWVLPVGEQDVDYRLDPDVAAPPTTQIASHFPDLAPEQAQLVRRFCETGLVERYAAMELPEDSFFEQERFWRLSLYDQDGTALHYHYRIKGDSIAPLTAPPDALSWTTEVPACKVYAALELGESLTSMYVRINDAAFDEETEEALAQADLVDDPLIRTLFNDQFGAYQAAQLRRLLSRAPQSGEPNL